MDPRVAISNYLARLAPRERLLLGVLLGCLVLAALYRFVWEGMESERQLLETRIEAREKSLSRMEQQRDEYLELQRKLEASQAVVAKQDPNFNLFSYLQSTVAQAVSREKIASMNPSTKELTQQFQEERVEIKLNQMSLPQVVTFLHRIEKGERALRFSRLQIKKRRDDPHTFDVIATVSLLKSVQAEES